MNFRLSTCLLIFLSLSFLSVFSYAGSENSNTEIIGTWVTDDSTAKIRIYVSKGSVEVEAWDSSDGEEFEVSNINWNGSELEAKFLMPSSGYITNSIFTLITPDELKEVYTGSGSGELIWEREEDSNDPIEHDR